ncbi:hypothetical protein CDD82_7068 [Ophiocordyceps australis]|uniref:Uncharacterized protein n=1 Tax=Ophiocordyceps australis TaxID=1399860 RepID=A0A2C5ZQH7_9HYPO|nr:hypothetical protein CDD82_7068 [Ophiocordyceps australis]
MFLHPGASLHGHEFSPRPHSTPVRLAQSKNNLLHTALRPLSPSELDQSPQQLVFGDSHSSRPSSLDIKPRASSLTSSRRRLESASPKKDLAVRFLEPPMDHIQPPLTSDDDESVAGSELSGGTNASARRAMRKRTPRRVTSFAIAHPAPQLRTKQRRLVQIRPRLLLQLQLVGDKRAIPAFDIVPSSLVGSIIIPRLAKRMFGAKSELGPNDALIVRSDDYEPSTPGSQRTETSESIEDRDVLAVITPLLPQQENSESCAEIVLEDGSSWLASLINNGSFEFNYVDDEGFVSTARWVRRAAASVRYSSSSFSRETQPTESRWTFSIIDPSSKRHPIMGSLTSESVQVYETYTALSTSSGKCPPCRPMGPIAEAYAVGDTSSASSPRVGERTRLSVTRSQKRLMLATATWISLHQGGWPDSVNPKYGRCSSLRSSSSGAPSRRQTFPADDTNGQSTQHRWSGIYMASKDSHSDVPSRTQSPTTVPTRAMSTGRAFMKRRSLQVADGETVNGAGAASTTTLRPSMEHQPIKAHKHKRQHGELRKREAEQSTSWLGQLVQKMFRRRRQGKHGDMARYKLEEL